MNYDSPLIKKLLLLLKKKRINHVFNAGPRFKSTCLSFCLTIAGWLPRGICLLAALYGEYVETSLHFGSFVNLFQDCFHKQV